MRRAKSCRKAEVMKVILSRKGFDSANGGILSPIFEDGTMLSFPIQAKMRIRTAFDMMSYFVATSV